VLGEALIAGFSVDPFKDISSRPAVVERQMEPAFAAKAYSTCVCHRRFVGDIACAIRFWRDP
jgi:hypothetical protein